MNDQEEYQMTVIQEQADIGDRLKRLNKFLETSAYSNLVSLDREILLAQREAMNTYDRMLRVRILRF